MAEQAKIALYLFGHKADEFTNGIEGFAGKSSEYTLFIIDVGNDLFYTVRHFVAPVATVQQPKVVTFCGQKPGDGTADGAGSTN